MSQLTIFLVLVVCSLAVNALSPPTPYQYNNPYGLQTASGAVGAQYGQQTGTAETHDKKNFGMNFSSDKGSTNSATNVNAQLAGTGAYAQGQGVYPQYPQYSYPQYQYPQYQQPYQQYVVPQAPQVPYVPQHQAGSGWGRY